jgi:hypothetical protein
MLKVERLAFDQRRGGGHLPAGDVADQAVTTTAAPPTPPRSSPRDRAGKDRDVGAGLDQPGAGQHLFGFRCCGRIAYLIGPKKVEWTPMANSAASISGIAMACHGIPCQASTRPAPPTSMIAISQNLTMRMIRALSRMSASWPASATARRRAG